MLASCCLRDASPHGGAPSTTTMMEMMVVVVTALVADAMMMKIAKISQPPRTILTYRRGSGRLHCNRRPFNVGTHAGGVRNVLHPEWSTLKGAFGASTFNAKQNVCKVNFVQARPYWGSAQRGFIRAYMAPPQQRRRILDLDQRLEFPHLQARAGTGGARSESRLRGQAQSSRTQHSMGAAVLRRRWRPAPCLPPPARPPA